MFRLVSQHETSADLKANGLVVEILKFKVPRSYPVERDDVFPSKLKLSVISEYYSHTHTRKLKHSQPEPLLKI